MQFLVSRKVYLKDNNMGETNGSEFDPLND